MSDLISREDAIKAVAIAALDDRDELEAIKALPSAEAVSMEEHIKELNDLAVEWKAKFAKAEKITDEIYDETMAKVAKECEECKERLQNIRPSADAEPSLKAIKRQIDEHWYLDPPSDEAVQGEWKRVETRTYKGECTNCGFRHIFMDGHDSQYRFCPYCGAKMTKGGDTE